MATVRGDLYDAVVAELEGLAAAFDVIKGPDPDVNIGAMVADVACKGKCVLEVFFGEDDVAPESQGMNSDHMVLPVAVVAHMGVAADLDTASLENRASEILGDVYTAMMSDPAWGGLALDTRVQTFSTGVVRDERDSVGTLAAGQTYLVRYRFRLGQPGTAV